LNDGGLGTHQNGKESPTEHRIGTAADPVLKNNNNNIIIKGKFGTGISSKTNHENGRGLVCR